MNKTPQSGTRRPDQLLAGIDLGSSSFHLVLARLRHGDIQVIEQWSQRVGLAKGLQINNRLSEPAMAKGLEALQQIAERVKHLDSEQVRIVGTDALRCADNAQAFCQAAQTMLGHNIEIISGREEARLVYNGVQHSLQESAEQQFIVDIGGGSTEFIIGKEKQAIMLESLHMGCLSYWQRFFEQAKDWPLAMTQAKTAACNELSNIRQNFLDNSWDVAIGASGSVRDIAQVIRVNGWGDAGISRENLQRVYDSLLQHRGAEKLLGVREDSRQIFCTGTILLTAIFEVFNIQYMHYAQGQLREGILYDLSQRNIAQDRREETIQSFMLQYQVDIKQALLVEQTAQDLLSQVAEPLALQDGFNARLLSWSSRLHELGLSISHNQFHKHGAYVVQHSDMLGFGRQQQLALATVIRGHRRTIPEIAFTALDEGAQSCLHLCLLLRFAVIIHRNRRLQTQITTLITVQDQHFHLQFPADYLSQNALTKELLQVEADYLDQISWRLSFC